MLVAKKSKLILWIFLPLLIVIMAFLLFGSVKDDSATTDEPIHILSGYLVLKDGDFRFNPEHPFLGKMLMAAPLLLIKPKIDYSERYFQVAADFYYDSWRETREMAQNFLYKIGNNADEILLASRSVPIVFALVFALVLFCTADRYYGLLAASISVFLYSLDPNILSHSRLANTDLWMMIFFFLAIISFGYYLAKPDTKRLLLTGLCFGLVQAVKFSAIILYLIIPIIYLIYYFKGENQRNFWQFAKGAFFRILAIFVIGFAVVWLTYGFSLEKVPSYQKIHESNYYNQLLVKTEPIVRIFQPAQYWKGIVFVLGSTYSPRPAYLWGHIQYGGWWYYFPLAFLVKTPLPTIILLALSIFFYFYWHKKLKFRDYVIITPVVVYILVSMTSKLNLGIRHLLPIYPFIFLWIGNFVQLWYRKSSKKTVVMLILLIFGIWYVYGAVKIYPYYLSYFNEMVGPSNGIKVLSDSNIDWGEDLKRLKKWLDDHEINEPIKLNYFWTGPAGPTYYGIDYQILEPDNPLQKGYVAISISSLQNKEYQWLKEYESLATIGYSIKVYKID